MVERLFLAVPRGCLRFVIVVFPDHTHLLFLSTSHVLEIHCLTHSRMFCIWNTTLIKSNILMSLNNRIKAGHQTPQLKECKFK